MDITPDQYGRIMAFVDADMSVEEIELFEKELAENESMRKQLKFELAVKDAVIRRDMEGLPKRIPLYRRTWFYAAAGLIPLFAVVIFLVIPQQKKGIAVTPVTDTLLRDTATRQTIVMSAKPSPDSIFAKLYRKDTIPLEYSPYLGDVLVAYADNNFEKVKRLDVSAKIDMLDPDAAAEQQKISAMGNYYKGLAYLATGDDTSAVRFFTTVINEPPETNITAKARWYLALVLVKQQKLPGAVAVLQTLIKTNPGPALVKQARLLLSAIKN